MVSSGGDGLGCCAGVSRSVLTKFCWGKEKRILSSVRLFGRVRRGERAVTIRLLCISSSTDGATYVKPYEEKQNKNFYIREPYIFLFMYM